MTKPTVHINGTAKVDLMEGYSEARHALMEAAVLLAKTAPSGRDYYPQGPDVIHGALLDYASRMNRINSVVDELMDLMMHVDEQ